MNYYPFHIGDFAAHTLHLTWEEDIAFRRMLDWYYLNEKALPGDASKVARLIRMPKSREAIDVVLAEFFVLSEDGYHNKRADAELTNMLDKQQQQSTKDAHEAERMRRHRERRALMFEALRRVNIVPAWDVSIKDLQRLHDENCNAPETRTGELPETDVQRLSLPTPIPTPIKEIPAAVASVVAPIASPNPKPKPKPKATKTLLPDGWVPEPDVVQSLAAEFSTTERTILGPYLGGFRDACKAKGYTYADFNAAFRNCVRQDWPKVRSQPFGRKPPDDDGLQQLFARGRG